MSVFISGASSGFGEACARVFAQAKRDLILVARRKGRLQALAAELKRVHGIQVSAYELDVRDRKAVDELVSAERNLFQKVDVLINNAGLAKGLSPIQSGNVDHWDQMIDTNIKGLLYVTRTLLPFLIDNRGHVVNIGSTAGHWAYPSGNVYCATKFAVHALSEAMRMDLHGTGVRVTEISPGMAETEFSLVRLDDAEKARAVYAGMTPLSASDVAEAVLWSIQRPRHVNIQQMILFPTDQSSVTLVKRN